jgi:hypothetical protein
MRNVEKYPDERLKRLRLRAIRYERQQEAPQRRVKRQQFLNQGFSRLRIRFPFNLLDGPIRFSLRAIEYLVWTIVTKIIR